MPTKSINGVSYHFEVAGAGPPLVLLHGFTGGAANWTALVDDFADAYTVITVDLLGHGQSDAPTDPHRYSMTQSADDLAALLATITAEQLHLLGYSMGGRLALYFACTYSERLATLLLESASPGLATADARTARQQSDERLADRIEHNGLEVFVDFWEQLPLFASQKSLSMTARTRLRTQRLQNSATGLANSLRGMGTGIQPSLWEELPSLKLPTLLLAGELDTKFVDIGQEMAEWLPDAEMIIVPDAGHTVHLEQPVRFTQQLHAFLANHLGA